MKFTTNDNYTDYHKFITHNTQESITYVQLYLTIDRLNLNVVNIYYQINIVMFRKST